MRRKAVALGIVVGIAIGAIGTGVVLRSKIVSGTQARPASLASAHDGIVLHGVIAREDVRVDLYVPPAGAKPAPWMVFAHERGWPAPDDKERSGAGIADALVRRGIAVAVVSFDVGETRPLSLETEHVAEAIRELAARAGTYGIAKEPVLAGDELGASLVTSLALDPRYGFGPGALRGVIAMNGVYDDVAGAYQDMRGAAKPRADAPPFLVLSAHGDSPVSAQSSRALTRALERAGAKEVHGHHVSTRDVRSLGNLSGDRNDVGDLVAAFVKGEEVPGGPEGTWALADTWGAHAPLSSEPFWADEKAITRRPTDARFRAAIRNVFGEMIKDLDPWAAATYDAIDLDAWLRAHPELGTGDFVEVTNARGEKIVLTRREIAREKPVLVVGIDDERNLFRLFVTYNVHRAYSWKPETEPRPLLVRNIGAFLFVPAEPHANGARGATQASPTPPSSLELPTLAEFALTTTSFRVVAKDPLAVARAVPKPLATALTNEQGCLQCHMLRGDGARAHHLRAADGKVAEAHGLPLEDYPRDVLSRFLFDQEAVAKSFGVGPLRVDATAAKQLMAEVSR